jgi:class 3 adenylate cyclase
MKRLTYISKFSRPLSNEDIESISRVATKTNKQKNITGVLLCYSGIFFLILEVDETNIDNLYQKILQDNRHTEILCLKTESNVRERLFPDWSMNTINLESNTDLFITPIKTLLKTITESHRILEKYTQPTLFRIINSGINPLEVPPRKVDKIILFSDIMSFSTFVDKLPVESVVELANHYCTICTKIITARGGEVNKFIGDCVMAYFSAEQGDKAIQASLEILIALERLRNSAPESSPLRVLYSGIGLARGIVIEGNIGSSVKKDYTILGDAVNVAQRLESLTRKVPRYIVFDRDVKNRLNKSWKLVELGTCQPKGKASPLQIYSIAHPITRKKSTGERLARHISNYLDS